MYVIYYQYNMRILAGIAGALVAIRSQVANDANAQQIDEGFALAFRVAVVVCSARCTCSHGERESETDRQTEYIYMSLLSDKMLGVIVFLARLDTRGKCLSRFMCLYSEIGSETDRQTEYIYIFMYIYVSLILGVNVSLA